MNTYEVTYRLIYPGTDDALMVAYVLAESFDESVQKAEKSLGGKEIIVKVVSTTLANAIRIVT